MRKYISCVIFLIILAILILVGFYYFDQRNRQDSGILPADKIKNLISNEQSFIIAVISDSERKENNLNNVYEKIINKIKQSDAKFLVHLGDFVHLGINEEFEEFKNYTKTNLDIPYYVTAGNHDILADEVNKSVFLKYFKDLYYSWDYNNWHFIVLDNSWNLKGFSDEGLDWLKQDLGKNKKSALIFMHRPTKIPYAEMFNINDGGTEQTFNSYNKFYEIINNGKNNIKEVYSGHIHMHFPFGLDNIPMTIVGSGGSKPQYDFMKNDESYYHYFEIKIDGDKHENRMVEIE